MATHPAGQGATLFGPGPSYGAQLAVSPDMCMPPGLGVDDLNARAPSGAMQTQSPTMLQPATFSATADGNNIAALYAQYLQYQQRQQQLLQELQQLQQQQQQQQHQGVAMMVAAADAVPGGGSDGLYGRAMRHHIELSTINQAASLGMPHAPLAQPQGPSPHAAGLGHYPMSAPAAAKAAAQASASSIGGPFNALGSTPLVITDGRLASGSSGVIGFVYGVGEGQGLLVMIPGQSGSAAGHGQQPPAAESTAADVYAAQQQLAFQLQQRN